jgi:acetyl-CoA C-acetyltransferase
MADVFIYDAARTPRGRGKAGKGGLSALHPQELLAQTLNFALAERSCSSTAPWSRTSSWAA